jgi:hypothetical protein
MGLRQIISKMKLDLRVHDYDMKIPSVNVDGYVLALESMVSFLSQESQPQVAHPVGKVRMGDLVGDLREKYMGDTRAERKDES